MKNKFGLVILTLVLIGLVCTVQAANIDGASLIGWADDSSAHLWNYYETDGVPPPCTKIVLDTSPIGGIITEPVNQITPPSGCTVSGWDTPQLTISCSPGVPVDSMPVLTNLLMEDTNGIPMVDFSGAKITATFGSNCELSGIFFSDIYGKYEAFYSGTCGDPINTPEFPSTFLPAAMIIGFLGAVLLIQRTREP